MAYFLQRKYCQKPRQWGPRSAVRWAVDDWFHRRGMPYPIVMIPFWENSGIAHDYGRYGYDTIFPVLNPGQYLASGALHNSSAYGAIAIGDRVNAPENIRFGYTDDFTAFTVIDPSAASNGQYVLAWSTSIYLQKRSINGTPYFYYGPRSQYNYTLTPFPARTCSFVGTHRASDGMLSMYLDGDLLHARTGSGTGAAQDYELCVGGDQYDYTSTTFNGQIYLTIVIRGCLSGDQIAQLHDDPYGMLQPRAVPIYSFASGTAGSTYQRSSAWEILTDATKNLAWSLLAEASKDSQWRLFGNHVKDVSWRDLAQADADLSWRIRNEASSPLSWRIFNSVANDSGWMIKGTVASNMAWRVLTTEQHEIAWAILNQSQSLRPIAWRILADASKAAAWRILHGADNASAWRIMDQASIDTAWQILVSGIFTQAISWRTLTTAEQQAAWRILSNSVADSSWLVFNAPTKDIGWHTLTIFSDSISWRILHDATSGTAWRVFRIKGHDTGWHILEQMVAGSAWTVFNAATRDIRWQIMTDEMPEPVATFLLGSGTTFAFNLADHSAVIFDFKLQ